MADVVHVFYIADASARWAAFSTNLALKMIYILYTQDHAKRAMALAGIIGARHGLISKNPEKVHSQLKTLIFWGHGDAWKLCGKTPAELASIVKAWRKLNSTIDSVELITCNARHYTGKTHSFADNMKRELRRGFRSSTRNITLKALPKTVTGSAKAFSILLAETNTKSWVYVTAPGTTDSLMMEGARLINFEVVNGKTQSFRGDIAQRADKMVREHRDRKWTMNYGYFNRLRDHLVKV